MTVSNTVLEAQNQEVNRDLEAENQEVNQDLTNQIVSKIVEMGCACATDLAGQLGGGKRPDDLRGALNALVARGILRRKVDNNDSRDYSENQVVYELAR